MSDEAGLRVVLCWHMHQPQYCDLISGEYKLPWSYLHATKDYVDMAAHLEAVPGARAVVNFAPVLLEQLSDYAGQVNGFLSENKPLRDPLLAALACPVLPAGKEQRMALVSACLRVNELRSIRRFSSYQKLAEMARWFHEHPSGMLYLGDQFIVAGGLHHLDGVAGQLVCQVFGDAHVGLPRCFGQPPLHVIGDRVDHRVHVRLFKEMACALDLFVGDRDALLLLELLGQVFDIRIAERPCHGRHHGILTHSIPEGLQLFHQVGRFLAGEIRPQRIGTDAVRSMTSGAARGLGFPGGGFVSR